MPSQELTIHRLALSMGHEYSCSAPPRTAEDYVHLVTTVDVASSGLNQASSPACSSSEPLDCEELGWLVGNKYFVEGLPCKLWDMPGEKARAQASTLDPGSEVELVTTSSERGVIWGFLRPSRASPSSGPMASGWTVLEEAPADEEAPRAYLRRQSLDWE